MFETKKTLIVVYKDELLMNQKRFGLGIRKPETSRVKSSFSER